MTIKELMELLVADRGPILLITCIALTIIQIAPIKINPWGTIFSWFGRQLNKDVITKIDVIEERLNTHIRVSEEIELRERRTNILDFSSSVLRGVNYHKEKFDFMIAECDSYEKYCTKNNIRNGVAEASIAEIRRIYQERLRNNDFLVDPASSRKG